MTLSDSQGNVINEPKPINILAWFMGGSLLLSSIGGMYYTRRRVKQCK